MNPTKNKGGGGGGGTQVLRNGKQNYDRNA